ncbi:MAG: 50S ribosomal protein L18 [Candidatus Gottesmanbacteria bacterium]
MMKRKSKKLIQSKRVARIRAKVRGAADRPRLSVYRSNKTIAVQVVDDEKKVTLFSIQGDGKNIKSAKTIGEAVIKKAKEKHIAKMVFDRGGHKYHGVVKMIADTVREGGITI